MYYTYVLYSGALDRLYIGQTQILENRINEHLILAEYERSIQILQTALQRLGQSS